MPESELLAIAAHLHVLLRRSCGRVTDTEWLAANAEYAAEIIRFAGSRKGRAARPSWWTGPTASKPPGMPCWPGPPSARRSCSAPAS